MVTEPSFTGSIVWKGPFDPDTLLSQRACLTLDVQHPDAEKVSRLLKQIDQLCNEFVAPEAPRS